MVAYSQSLIAMKTENKSEDKPTKARLTRMFDIDGNRIVCAVMICIGCFPFVYIQLGTNYPKAGMVSIISITVVALSTVLETVPGMCLCHCPRAL